MLNACFLRSTYGGKCLLAFVGAGLPEIGDEENAVRSRQSCLESLRAIQVRHDYFVGEVAMFVGIARHRAHLELAVGPQRTDDPAALQSGRAENGDDLLIEVCHDMSP